MLQSSLFISDFKILKKNLKVLLQWVESFRNIVAKYIDFKSNGIELIIMNPDFHSTVYEILLKNFSLNQQQDNILFMTSSSQQINKLLNETKAKTLKAFNMIINYLIKTSSNSGGHIIEVLDNFIQVVYRSLLKYNDLRIKFTFLCEKPAENLAIQCILFLHKICLLKKFHEFFQKNQKNLFYDILLPFFIASGDELTTFNDNPEKFRDVSQVYCSDKEDVETLKGISCSLLKTLTQNVDGFLTHVFHLMKEILYFSISNNQNDLETGYPKMKELIYFKSFFLETTVETRIETSLMVLAILNHEVLKRADLM